MTLRAPYRATLYAPGMSDAVWIWDGPRIVALMSPANAVRFYGVVDGGIFG